MSNDTQAPEITGLDLQQQKLFDAAQACQELTNGAGQPCNLICLRDAGGEFEGIAYVDRVTFSVIGNLVNCYNSLDISGKTDLLKAICDAQVTISSLLPEPQRRELLESVISTRILIARGSRKPISRAQA